MTISTELKIPNGTLITFVGREMLDGELSYNFSSLGIKSGDSGIVIEHNNPHDFRCIVGGKLIQLSLFGTSGLVEWCHEIAILEIPDGLSCKKWIEL